MVRLIDPRTGQVREVSDETYRRVWDTPEGGIAQRLSDESQTNRLWDNVDGAWTLPLPQATIPLYLHKVIFRCTACTFTGLGGDAVLKHLKAIGQNAEEHEGATLLPQIQQDGRVGLYCTGCGVLFSGRKGQGKKHLENVHQAVPLHEGARSVQMHRFSLVPPPTPVPSFVEARHG